MKKWIVLFMSSALLSVPVFGQGKNSSLERAITKEVLDTGSKGGSPPSNPGAHGRANAEIKKATNPGKGSGNNSSLGGALLGELLEDDDDERGNSSKGKGKNK